MSGDSDSDGSGRGYDDGNEENCGSSGGIGYDDDDDDNNDESSCGNDGDLL